ncbi:MAG TPA: peptide ABC transporter substrate-binding protein [Firmicutes bacterium]|nr:peptide ABC transporter substrate-binding protein [Bacillota bacterium]
MKKTKRWLSLLLAASLCVSLAACSGGGGNSSAASSGEKVLTLSDAELEGGFDPAGFALGGWVTFARLCSAPLLSYDNEGNEIMESAESYETSDDQLVWTFHLREDAKWSDGSAVTAADFINTIRRALDPETSQSIYADQLYVIAGAEAYHAGEGSWEGVQVFASDDYTLEFHLAQPCGYFLKLLSLPVYYPSKEGVATTENEAWATTPETCLCNGAYMLTEFVQGQYYTIEKNPYYYNAGEVKIDTITTRIINDTQAKIAAYEAGEIDVANGLPDYIETQYEGTDELAIWNMLTTLAVMPNLEVEPLDDVRVREAIALALSRDTIAASMGANYEASYTWVPKYMQSNVGSGLFSEEAASFSEDAERAKELLAEAGYPDGAGFPNLTYTYPNNDKDALLAQALQAQLKSVLNIDISLQAQESEVYNTTKSEGSFDLLRYSWTADFDDPINYLSMFVSTSALNFNHVSDSAFDEAVAASNVASDQQERNGYLHEAETILVDENFYIIPVTTMHYIGLRNPSITNVQYDGTGLSLYRYADIS